MIFFHGSLVHAQTQAMLDSDGDGLTDYDEVHIYHTDPYNADTDRDGFNDGEEVQQGFSPLVGGHKRLDEVDTDGDGLNDAAEIALGTDLSKADTDGDAVSDYGEVTQGVDPLVVGAITSTVKRAARADLSTQQLAYFFNGVQLGSVPISSGTHGTTPTGTFAFQRKVPVIHYVGPGYDLPNTKWNIQFKPHFYVHGAYWHTQFGVRVMSHGCLNVAYKDVEKLYNFFQVGDKITIVGAPPVGRLAHPITVAIDTVKTKTAEQVALRR